MVMVAVVLQLAESSEVQLIDNGGTAAGISIGVSVGAVVLMLCSALALYMCLKKTQMKGEGGGATFLLFLGCLACVAVMILVSVALIVGLTLGLSSAEESKRVSTILGVCLGVPLACVAIGFCMMLIKFH